MKKSKFSDEQIVRILQESAKGEVIQVDAIKTLLKKRVGPPETAQPAQELIAGGIKIKRACELVGLSSSMFYKPLQSKKKQSAKAKSGF